MELFSQSMRGRERRREMRRTLQEFYLKLPDRITPGQKLKARKEHLREEFRKLRIERLFESTPRAVLQSKLQPNARNVNHFITGLQSFITTVKTKFPHTEQNYDPYYDESIEMFVKYEKTRAADWDYQIANDALWLSRLNVEHLIRILPIYLTSFDVVAGGVVMRFKKPRLMVTDRGTFQYPAFKVTLCDGVSSFYGACWPRIEWVDDDRKVIHPHFRVYPKKTGLQRLQGCMGQAEPYKQLKNHGPESMLIAMSSFFSSYNYWEHVHHNKTYDMNDFRISNYSEPNPRMQEKYGTEYTKKYKSYLQWAATTTDQPIKPKGKEETWMEHEKPYDW